MTLDCTIKEITTFGGERGYGETESKGERER